MFGGLYEEAGCHLIEVKTIVKPHRDFDYLLLNRNGRLIGGHLLHLSITNRLNQHAQQRNAFFATINQMFGGSSQLLTMLFEL